MRRGAQSPSRRHSTQKSTVGRKTSSRADTTLDLLNITLAESGDGYPRMRFIRPNDLAMLWEALDIPMGERAFAERVIQRRPHLRKEYIRRLGYVVQLRSRYNALIVERAQLVSAVRQTLRNGKGSKKFLAQNLTRIQALTIHITSVVNAARTVCKKPIILQPFSLTSTSPELNWLIYLGRESLYSRPNLALIMTIFQFCDHAELQRYIDLVDDFYRCCEVAGTDDSFSVTDLNYAHESSGDISPIPPGSVALYFLLGIQAEAVFANDSMAIQWNTFLHTQHGAQPIDYCTDYPLLTPIQILEAVRIEEDMIQEFGELILEARADLTDLVLVPVDTSQTDSYETYKHILNDEEDDLLFLQEYMERKALNVQSQPPLFSRDYISARPVVSVFDTGVEARQLPTVLPRASQSITRSVKSSLNRPHVSPTSERPPYVQTKNRSSTASLKPGVTCSTQTKEAPVILRKEAQTSYTFDSVCPHSIGVGPSLIEDNNDTHTAISDANQMQSEVFESLAAPSKLDSYTLSDDGTTLCTSEMAPQRLSFQPFHEGRKYTDSTNLQAQKCDQQSFPSKLQQTSGNECPDDEWSDDVDPTLKGLPTLSSLYYEEGPKPHEGPTISDSPQGTNPISNSVVKMSVQYSKESSDSRQGLRLDSQGDFYSVIMHPHISEHSTHSRPLDPSSVAHYPQDDSLDLDLTPDVIRPDD
ncbi:hypothetical protein GMRT_10388 [Giardia muris]|uniref:Uncharacterized protein n=1 Tax=Giardia muris TaxID=5742 RepID=A0A4Z1SX16_GIAMU|nr:hypothetical protein GMRT_10388 [Giardia muris]|eukprot:TNJ30342.1 hypothetical protein GMRT_10388 [Giardia muris]